MMFDINLDIRITITIQCLCIQYNINFICNTMNLLCYVYFVIVKVISHPFVTP